MFFVVLIFKIMKKLLPIVLMVLLTLPWSAISAGACPMKHAAAQVKPAPEERPSCCSHENTGDSHQVTNRNHRNNNGSCNGDCCPVCHLVQDTPQDNDEIFSVTINYPKIIGSLPNTFIESFKAVVHSSLYPSVARLRHLKRPVAVLLRI